MAGKAEGRRVSQFTVYLQLLCNGYVVYKQLELRDPFYFIYSDYGKLFQQTIGDQMRVFWRQLNLQGTSSITEKYLIA